MGSTSASEEALTHILDNVFCLGEDSPLRLALENGGFKKIQSVATMSNAVLTSLRYRGKDGNGKAANLPILLNEQGLRLRSIR